MWHPSQVQAPSVVQAPGNYAYVPYPPVHAPVLVAPAYFPNGPQNQPMMYPSYVFVAQPFPTESNTQNTFEMTSYVPQPMNYPLLVNNSAPQRLIDMTEEELKLMNDRSKTKSDSSIKAPQRSPNHSKKCKKCNKFYRDSENEMINGEHPCRYHPGKFRTVYHSKLAFGNIQSWSCCKDAKREASGCKFGIHVEDVATTLALEAFDLSVHTMDKEPNSISQSNDLNSNLIDLNFDEPKKNLEVNTQYTQNSLRRSNRKFEVEKTILKQGNLEFFNHQVSLTDTLSGLSLKYKVSIDEIKSTNKIRKQEELYTRREILIPYRGQSLDDTLSEEERKKYNQDMKLAYIKKFRRATHCNSDNEAKFYLKSNAWCLDLAIQEFKEDSSWEKQFPPPKPLSLKVA